MATQEVRPAPNEARTVAKTVPSFPRYIAEIAQPDDNPRGRFIREARVALPAMNTNRWHWVMLAPSLARRGMSGELLRAGRRLWAEYLIWAQGHVPPGQRFRLRWALEARAAGRRVPRSEEVVHAPR